VEERQTAPGRSCGSCSLCCKLLRVLELDKPANEWCDFCNPGHGGCSIYDSRPSICRGYYCGWMLSSGVGDEWYPLTCHMILSIGRIDGVQMVTVTVDGKYPLVWREPKYHQQLVRMAHGGLKVNDPDKVYIVQVRVDNRVWLVLPDRDIEITRCSYILKLARQGEWEVEQFPDSTAAADRVRTLTGASA
jgi:uncharacterized protein